LNTSKLEETTAEILGQIQASVAEYVRTMNEAGALRRRETDEAHRQQDQALAAIAAIELQGKAILARHTELVTWIGKEWANLVNRGAKEIAIAQARECASATILTIEQRAEEHAERVRKIAASTEAVIARADEVNRTLAWKTVATATGFGVGLTMLLVALVWWRGNVAIRDRVAQYAALEVAAASVRVQAPGADLVGCNFQGENRLCIRLDGEPLEIGEGDKRGIYAPVHIN
jgi:hypothetical protein